MTGLSIFRRGSRLLAVAVIAAAGVWISAPARAAMVNCAQGTEDLGMNAEDFLHFDRNENCFGDPDARFLGYSVLINNDSEQPCDATLFGGAFADGKWSWSTPKNYHFGRFEKKEVYYDLSAVLNITVGQIELLHSGRGVNSQCGRNLMVRYTLEDPLPAKGTYFNTPGNEAYFKIYSEDFSRNPRARGFVLGRTVVRLPLNGENRSRGAIPYEFYTDVHRSQFPLEPAKKGEPDGGEKFLSEFDLEKWDPDAKTWETVEVSLPKDVSGVTVRCADDSPDCYGDQGEMRRILGDGYYRLRARHYWKRRGWMEWSSWRIFTVNFRTPVLAKPDPNPPWTVQFELWLFNHLLGPFGLWG